VSWLEDLDALFEEIAVAVSKVASDKILGLRVLSDLS
jgi:hypothetical protein